MLQLLPFIVFGIAFAALVVWLVLRDRAKDAAREQRLLEMGFVKVDAVSEGLMETVTTLENNAEFRYKVEDPMRGTAGSKVVYFYTKTWSRSGYTNVAEELLFQMQRPSAEGMMLLIKPGDIPVGTATRMIGAVATGAWDSQPDDLGKIEVPIDLKDTNLLGVLGPAGSSLYSLMDAQTVSILQGAGDCGALIVNCRGQWCSFTSTGSFMPLDLDKALPLIGLLP